MEPWACSWTRQHDGQLGADSEQAADLPHPHMPGSSSVGRQLHVGPEQAAAFDSLTCAHVPGPKKVVLGRQMAWNSIPV